jgi:peptidoglycan hydrolase CwlO-like protein
VKFIEDDNKTTSERIKEAEQATQDRKKCEAKIKGLDNKIQNLYSDIDKNIDQLTALEHHKKFLFGIF